MMGAELRKRVAMAEESRASQMRHDLDAQLKASISHLRSVLYAGLLERSDESECRLTDKYGKNRVGLRTKSFSELVIGLHFRITSDSLTDADIRVLNSLSRDDLKFLNMTAADFVGMYWRLFTKYSAV